MHFIRDNGVHRLVLRNQMFHLVHPCVAGW